MLTVVASIDGVAVIESIAGVVVEAIAGVDGVAVVAALAVILIEIDSAL